MTARSLVYAYRWTIAAWVVACAVFVLVFFLLPAGAAAQDAVQPLTSPPPPPLSSQPPGVSVEMIVIAIGGPVTAGFGMIQATIVSNAKAREAEIQQLKEERANLLKVASEREERMDEERRLHGAELRAVSERALKAEAEVTFLRALHPSTPTPSERTPA